MKHHLTKSAFSLFTIPLRTSMAIAVDSSFLSAPFVYLLICFVVWSGSPLLCAADNFRSPGNVQINNSQTPSSAENTGASHSSTRWFPAEQKQLNSKNNSTGLLKDVSQVVKKMNKLSPQNIKIDVVTSQDIFSRVNLDSGHIQISSTLLNDVYKSSGSEGVAFLLGHEAAHLQVDPSVKGAAVEFEADRIGFDMAKQVCPQLNGTTVKKVFDTFDKAGSSGKMSNMLNKIHGAADKSHPTDLARLDSLARHHNYSTQKGFNKIAGRGGYLSSAPSRATASLKTDFVKGGLLVDVAVSAGSSLYNSFSTGNSFGESLKNTGKYLTSSTFIAGDLLAGAAGAAIGSMIPIPASVAAAGLLGQSIATFPAIAGAMLGAQLGITAIELMKNNEFSVENLMKSVNIIDTVFRAAGASIGMAVGSLIPVPFAGTIAGGIIGSIVADKILSLFKKKESDFSIASQSRPAAPTESTIPGQPANAANQSRKQPGTNTKTGNAAEPSSSVNGLSVNDLKKARKQADSYYNDFVKFNRLNKTDEAYAALLKYQECLCNIQTIEADKAK